MKTTGLPKPKDGTEDNMTPITKAGVVYFCGDVKEL